jgi:spore coat polysaccharide biosynthesis protein SpsF
MFSAATGANAETVVRITGDCPLIDWDVIDAVVDRLATENVDYCSNTVERTFPRGLDVEAFSYESFKHIHENAKEPHHREHVTPYYRENDDRLRQDLSRYQALRSLMWFHLQPSVRLVRSV